MNSDDELVDAIEDLTDELDADDFESVIERVRQRRSAQLDALERLADRVEASGPATVEEYVKRRVNWGLVAILAA